MKPVVFLGPSLSVGDARRVLNAIYLPPAQQADLLSVVTNYRPRVIGLIDGVFSQSLSVWHKEILFALSQGVSVYGASSMGALRAVETAEYGMIGVGEVYRMFATGELNDDDEVALMHAEAASGYRNLSKPMVNIRKTLQLAAERGLIDASTHESLIEIGKELFFPERDFPLIFRLAQERGISPEIIEQLRPFVAEHYVDVKRQDALALLRCIRELPPDAAPAKPSFSFTRSHLFEALYNRDRTVRHNETDVPLASISAHAALHLPGFNELNADALNRELVSILAEVLGVEVTDEEVEGEKQRFRVARALADDDPDDFDDWLERNDLTPEEFLKLMRNQAECRKMQLWLVTRKYLERTTKTVLDELRLRGLYEEMAESAAKFEQIISENFPSFEYTSHADIDMEQLVADHLRETSCRMNTNYVQWAEEAGFKDVFDLRYELLRARRVRHLLRSIGENLQETLGEIQQVNDVE